jgi:hypothetical protein
MSEFVQEAPGQRVSKLKTSLEVISCKVYSKMETIKKCRQYRVVGYYRKEYQKAD